MGILQRYVFGEVLRAFALALLTMTSIFVLFMVAAEAMRSRLLTPQDVVQLVPFVIPSTLPYTMPVSLLFGVTVVYGRIAGDNEVIAVKAAGLSVMKIIWPTILLAAGLSLFLLQVSGEWIPRSAHRAKQVIFKDLEDTFYKFLKRDRQFDNSRWPFLIKVRDVEGRTMIDATFKHRAKGQDNSNTYDAVIQAKRAELHFNLDEKLVRVHLDQAEIQHYGKEDDVMLINKNILEIPIPADSQFEMAKAIQEYTNAELVEELVKAREKLATERKREAIKASFAFALGRFDSVNWGDVQQANVNHGYWEERCNSFETEKQLRKAMAFGSLLFAVLGAPVGILFAKRDFLSAFMTCFVPIITVYYPLTLFGINLGKEGQMDPTIALWMGNTVLAILAGLVLPRVIKH